MFVCPIHLYTPIHSYAPRGVHTPHMPHTPLCHLYVLGGFACCGGCKGLPFVLGHFPYTNPVWGCLPFIGTPQTQLLASLCIGMFQGYKYVMWAFSLLLRGLGVFPHQLGDFGGIST